MGVGVNKLYCTRIEEKDELMLSGYEPIWNEEKKGYFMPPDTPLGYDLFSVPDLFPDLKFGDKPIEVKVEETEDETGLWLVCGDAYFGGEEWLVVDKPHLYDDNPKKLNLEYVQGINCLQLVDAGINAESGNIYNVKLNKKC